jgi:lipoprotein signal peptidase
MVELLAVWTAVFFTLGIYSILYRENPWYRIAESVYLGVAVGYGVSVDLLYIRNQWTGQWNDSAGMILLFAIVIIVGLMWYGRFTKGTFFLYRWPLAIIVGTGIGLALRTVIDAQFLQQIVAQVKTPFVTSNMLTTINNILVQIMVPSVLLYFWFTGTIRESAPMKVVEKIARYTMMAGFGSAYGYTVLTRYSLFIGRSQFLLGIPPNDPENQLAFIVIAFVMLASMIGWDLTRKKAPAA